MNKEEQIKILKKAKLQSLSINESSMKKDLFEGELLRVVYRDIGVIEEIILKSCIFLDTSLLYELPDDENIFYNQNNHRDNFISELEYDFKKLKIKRNPPLRIKSGKCNFCYPKNKTYTFHNPELDELIFRCVVDKVDDKNYIVMVCENKPKSKSPSLSNDYPI